MSFNETHTTKYSEMTDEQINAIARRIEEFRKSNAFWEKYVHPVKRQRGSKNWETRRVVKPHVDPASIAPATELVAPRPIKPAVETFVHTVDIYRDKFVYSAEDVLFGFDDIVKIGGDTLAEIFNRKMDLIAGKPFVNSKCTVTYATSYLATLEKAAIILRKNEAQPWANGRFLAIVTPEVMSIIRGEIRTLGAALAEATKEQLDRGVVGNFERWEFAESTSELLLGDSGHISVLMGRRQNGQSPVDGAKMDGVEIINNPLGSGILLDEDGELTSDDNKQKGSIAMNANGIGYYINDDLCILNLVHSETTIGKSVLDAAEKTDHKSISPASTLTVAAVKAADGTSIASPTVTIKKKDSSGTAVTASGGVYPVVPGDVYYYSVAKSDYTTATGTFVAKAGANNLVIALAAA